MAPVRRRQRRASVATELALVTPLLFVMMVGVMEWGWFLGRQRTFIHAVRDAARAGAISIAPNDPAAVAEARLQARLAAQGYDTGDLTATYIVDATSVGDVVTVDAALAYTPLIDFLPMPVSLMSTASMRLDPQ